MSGGWSSPEARSEAVPAGAEASVSVARSAAEIAALVPEWEALAGAALEPNPFYEPWMLLPAIESLADGAQVFVAAVRIGKELAGIFPLHREARYRGIPAGALHLWRHRHCLLCVPLVRAALASRCLDAFLSWAGEAASVVEVTDVPIGGAFHRALIDAIARRGHSTLAFNLYTRAALRREQSAEAYLAAAMSSATRRKLMRKERRLAERGELRRVCLGPADDIGQWIGQFLALEASGWKGARGSALASNEGNHRFALSVLPEAFRRGRLFGLGLDLDGIPIARCCTILASPGSFAFKTAYDERYADFSPGVLAELDRIAAFHELEGIAWTDSFTGPNNKRLDAMWKDRIGVQTVALSVSRWGELVLAALPLVRWAKQALTKK
jgi:CelD/BcsL family acetyltransferase involved in cellulose biosynthesis